MSRDDKTPQQVVQVAFPEPGKPPEAVLGNNPCAPDCGCHADRTGARR